MTPKGPHPPLYELMRGRRGKSDAAPPPAADEAEPAAFLHWLSPGRRIRVPVGYLLLGAAAIMVLVVGAFTAGYTRGVSLARAEFERDWPAIAEPLRRVPPPESAPSGTAAAGADETADVMIDQAAAAGIPEWGPVLSDPRRPGMNYFVLIHTRRDKAIQLAEFCRADGVEAYVVKADNVSLYRVIALPGYERGQRDSAPVRRLEARIVEVANKWRLQVNPSDDLGYYPEKFDG